LVGQPEGKRSLGRPRRRWVDNINRDLRQIEWGGKDWIDVARDRKRWSDLVNTVMFLSSCTTGGLSRRAQLHGVS
jgi:hypothetical protein